MKVITVIVWVLCCILICYGAATSQASVIHEALTETAASFLIETLSYPLMRLSHQLSPLADKASLLAIDTHEQT